MMDAYIVHGFMCSGVFGHGFMCACIHGPKSHQKVLFLFLVAMVHTSKQAKIFFHVGHKFSAPA